MNKIITIILLAISFNVNAATCMSIPEGIMPYIEQTDRYIILCNEDYISYYDTKFKIPVLTVEEITKEEVQSFKRRTNNFRPDPRVREEKQASLLDYKYSGYDRGHMAASSNFVGSEIEQSESFYLTNIVPQNPSLNRGLWKKLEDNSRLYAVLEGKIYVVTGTIINNCEPTRTIGEGVVVPDELYKINYNEDEPTMSVAYVVSNEKPEYKVPEKYLVSVWEINQKMCSPAVLKE